MLDHVERTLTTFTVSCDERYRSASCPPSRSNGSAGLKIAACLPIRGNGRVGAGQLVGHDVTRLASDLRVRGDYTDHVTTLVAAGVASCNCVPMLDPRSRIEQLDLSYKTAKLTSKNNQNIQGISDKNIHFATRNANRRNTNSRSSPDLDHRIRPSASDSHALRLLALYTRPVPRSQRCSSSVLDLR